MQLQQRNETYLCKLMFTWYYFFTVTEYFSSLQLPSISHLYSYRVFLSIESYSSWGMCIEYTVLLHPTYLNMLQCIEIQNVTITKVNDVEKVTNYW